MNQGRIWCVVHPTVGLPLLLGSVAITSLVVHASVMTHTTWMSNYWQGNSKGRTAQNAGQPAVASAGPKTDSAFVISIAPVTGTPGKAETAFVVTVAPNPATAASPASTHEPVSPPTSRTVTAAAAKLE